MPAPYSNDLRERVVRAYLESDDSYVDVARRFDVGEATVDRWVSRYRRTGSVGPDPMGGDRHSKFDDRSVGVLLEFVEAAPDATLVELADRLAEEVGLDVSPSAVSRALNKLGLSRKKRLSTQQNRTPNGSGPPGRSSSRR